MEPNQIVLYVNDIAASRAFYSELLGGTALEPSPAFNIFPLKSGATLALFQRSDEVPDAPAGGFELVFDLPDRESVGRTASEWKERGVQIVNEPGDSPFGYWFIAVDPDGTRLRAGYFPQG